MITADSTPDYDEWGPDTYWRCQDWVDWYSALEARDGSQKADRTWARAWTDGVSRAGGGAGIAPGSGWIADSVPIGCRTFDSAFRALLRRRPYLHAAVYSGIGSLARPLGVAEDLTTAAESASKGAANAVGMHPWLPWVIGGGVALLLLSRK